MNETDTVPGFLELNILNLCIATYMVSIQDCMWSVIVLAYEIQGFPGGSEGKASACNAGDLGSIPGSGRSPGEGNGNPPQHSCLDNPMAGGAW